MSSLAVRRMGVVAIAAIATLAEFLILRAAGIDFAVRQGSSIIHVGPVAVALATVLAGLAAWALLALLKNRGVWIAIALAVLVISLVGPLGAQNPGAGVGLAAMHMTVGIIVILGLP